LYLTQTQLKDGSSSKIDVINPLTGKSASEDVEELAKTKSESDGGVAGIIDPESVQQIIHVCFDESRSMMSNLAGYQVARNAGFHRVTIAAQYLTTFANRLYAYRVPCLQGLITFGKEIRVRSNLSPLVPYFEDGIKQVVPCGGTPLWDCLSKARDDLVAVNTDLVTRRRKFPNARMRILVISDGEDSSSTSQPADTANALIEAGITLDAVILCTNDTCNMLCAVCHVTGGLAFRPPSIDVGLALFEQEAFLNSVKRPAAVIQKKVFTEEELAILESRAVFDEAIANRDLDIARGRSRLITAREVVFKNALPPTETRTARIMREVRWAAAIQDPSLRAVDPGGRRLELFDEDVRIYPFAEDINLWRVFLRGPSGTPYERKWWYLTVTFPPGYPGEPPVFRFISVPFHVNVSEEGRICLNLIERGYVQSAMVFEMIQSVKQLFLVPDEETPVQLSKLALFRENRAEYDRRARMSCQREAKSSPDEWLVGIAVSDAVPAGFRLDPVTFVPQCERSAFTGDPIPRDKQVKASSGIIYHRDELKQYIASTANPVCAITGKLLTETLADFD
jgi:ubiquitin-protein ligase